MAPARIALQLDAEKMTLPIRPQSLDSKESRARDSLFLLAELQFAQSDHLHKVKVRNLSPGGMMVESDLEVTQGQQLIATLRNIGAVRGQIAWVSSGRFGVAFDRDVDPMLARQPVGGTAGVPRYLRPTLGMTTSAPRKSGPSQYKAR